MKEPYPINIFEVKININTKILSIFIQEFIIEHDYCPYIIMNETTLKEMEKHYFAAMDIFEYDNIKYKIKTIPRFEGCKILIDNGLNDGEVLLR